MAKKKHTRRYQYQTLDVNAAGSVKTTFGLLLVAVVVALAASLAYVWLRSGTETWERRAAERRQEYEVKVKKRHNLKVELETYRGGRYILSAVHHWNLDLHPPYPGQVRRVAVDEKSTAEDTWEESLVVDRRELRNR